MKLSQLNIYCSMLVFLKQHFRIKISKRQKNLLNSWETGLVIKLLKFVPMRIYIKNVRLIWRSFVLRSTHWISKLTQYFKNISVKVLINILQIMNVSQKVSFIISKIRSLSILKLLKNHMRKKLNPRPHKSSISI